MNIKQYIQSCWHMFTNRVGTKPVTLYYRVPVRREDIDVYYESEEELMVYAYEGMKVDVIRGTMVNHMIIRDGKLSPVTISEFYN